MIKNYKKRRSVLLILLFMICFSGVLQTETFCSANAIASAKKVSKGKWIKTGEGKKYRYSNRTYAQDIWLKIKGKYYYFNNKGICETGWITYDGDCYYAASDGQIFVKKWLIKNNNRYYFQSNGVRLQDAWHKLGKEYRYLGSDGKMVSNAWVDNYYVDKNGKRLKNCVKDEYYLNSEGKKVVEVFKGEYIFLGDSRMVGMQTAKAPANTKYISLRSTGYKWLKQTAGTTLQYYLKANPKVKVVLALGVNDLENIKSYISYYKTLIRKYPKTKFYVLSVNPVDETPGKRYCKYVKNTEIQNFNKKLKKAFPRCYIDSNTYMWKKGFDAPDGLHYTAEEYRDLYDFLVEAIK